MTSGASILGMTVHRVRRLAAMITLGSVLGPTLCGVTSAEQAAEPPPTGDGAKAHENTPDLLAEVIACTDRLHAAQVAAEFATVRDLQERIALGKDARISGVGFPGGSRTKEQPWKITGSGTSRKLQWASPKAKKETLAQWTSELRQCDLRLEELSSGLVCLPKKGAGALAVGDVCELSLGANELLRIVQILEPDSAIVSVLRKEREYSAVTSSSGTGIGTFKTAQQVVTTREIEILQVQLAGLSFTKNVDGDELKASIPPVLVRQGKAGGRTLLTLVPIAGVLQSDAYKVAAKARGDRLRAKLANAPHDQG